jgi:WXXGXW repeat (2 copies)
MLRNISNVHSGHWFLGLLAAFAAAAMLAVPMAAPAQVSVGVAIHVGPPPLPVYVQPVCPGPNYIWIPGYWAWGPDGYYWIPGTWVLAPYVDALWTPGYWAWETGGYIWHPGYWGPHVGFYGGIDYGFGYFGVGYVGGAWRNGFFAYNTAVTNVNVAVVHHTYREVVRRRPVNHRISYNGGGGIHAQPSREEMAYAHERHTPATAVQRQHAEAASRDHALLSSVNHGRPPIAATRRPGEFNGGNVVGPRAPNRNVPARRNQEAARPPVAREQNAGQPAESRPNRSQARPPANRPAENAPRSNRGNAPARQSRGNERGGGQGGQNRDSGTRGERGGGHSH